MHKVNYLDETQVIDQKETAAPINYSRSGCGNKIPTSWMVQLGDSRWRRVYVICYSNSGSAYIRVAGEKLFLGSYDPRHAASLPARIVAA